MQTAWAVHGGRDACTADTGDDALGLVELQVASYRPDGTLRPYVTMWTVTTGDQVPSREEHR